MRNMWILPGLSMALAVLMWLVPAPVVRYCLAFAFLWIIPGIAWATLIPSHAFKSIERHSIGMGLSFVVTTLTVMLLYYLPGPLTKLQLIAGIGIITSLPVCISAWKAQQSKARKVQGNPKQEAANQAGKRAHLFSKDHPFWQDGWIWLLIALLIAASLRLINLNYSEFQGDEGTVMVRAARALEGEETILFQHKKGPAELVAVMAPWRLTGITNETMARIPFTWANLWGIVAVYLIARRISSPRTAGIAALIFAIEGYFTAFGRIAQYQSIVFLLSSLGLLTLLIYHESGQATLVLLSAGLFAGGFLGHYDAALALPAGLLIIGDRLWRERHQGWQILRPIGLAALLGLILIALFYVPFLKSPFMEYTQTYLGERLGEDRFFHNNLWKSFNLSAVYNSVYLLVTLFSLIAGQLLQTWLRWGKRSKNQEHIAWIYGAVGLLLCLLILTGLLWPEHWVVGEKLTLAWIPGLILLGGAICAPEQSIEKRMLWIWFSVPALFYIFIVASPNTHIHTFFTAGILLASIQIAQFIRYLKAHPAALSYLAGTIAVLLYGICGYYTIMVFVDHTPEYRRTYPEFKNPFYWTPYEEMPKDGLFGFPYRVGWKVAGYLMDQGKVSSYYKSNEEPQVTEYYTHQATWWHCPAPDVYVTAINVQDELGIDWQQIQRDYQSVAIMKIEGQEKMTIFQREDTEIPPVIYDGEAYDWTFDLNTTPDRVAWGTPKTESRMPDTYIPLAYTFGDFARLRGYTLETEHAAPEGYIDLTLYWESLNPTATNYHVFIHLYDGTTMYGQVDQQPACDSLPTSIWKPGQIIRDRYRIPLSPETPVRTIPLIVGMYDLETMARVAITEETALPAGDAIQITEISIQEP